MQRILYYIYILYGKYNWSIWSISNLSEVTNDLYHLYCYYYQAFPKRFFFFRQHGDVAHWTCQKSIENKGISHWYNGFWTLNNAATLTYDKSFKCLEFEQFEQHEYGNNLEIKFCDLSFILWKLNYQHQHQHYQRINLNINYITL